MMKSDLQKVIIIGAGGHAHIAAEIISTSLEDTQSFDLLGFLDDNPTRTDKIISGKPVLGQISDLAKIPHDGVFIAIGYNPSRAKLYDQLIDQGENLVNLIHHSVFIASDVVLGRGVLAAPGAIINPGTVIGNNVIINTGATVDHHNRIGDHAHIAPGVTIGGDVVVGEGTLVGLGSSILPQTSIGDWAIIGAGSVVTRDLPGSITAFGIPAKISGQ